jgi:methionyl-tRNA formyltransferase
VIINQERKTGVTFHEMAREVDLGAILYQEEIVIEPYETGWTLWNKCAGKFIEIFDTFFCDFISGGLKKKEVDGQGTYYSRMLPFDGYIDTNWSIEKVDSFIRAIQFPPHKGAKLRIGIEEFEVNTLAQYKRLQSL